MRLVRLERQQSRVADDIRAALASLGRGSTVIGGIALIGVGSVTERPIEAVVLLPHGVIIVIGVDLPDPALRLEAPLGAPWKADGWPLVADDDAVNPATEALDVSQACERRIATLVPGTGPVGTIVAVGPYVETVDQPAGDLAGPVRVLHPTPTTMLAATVSLATAHRPRSVDQVRALIRGLAPEAPEFSDEVLLGEGFSRFTDDAPPESLWDSGAAVPAQAAAASTANGADWRTKTPAPVEPEPAPEPEVTPEAEESEPEPLQELEPEPAAEAIEPEPQVDEAPGEPGGEPSGGSPIPDVESERTEVLPFPGQGAAGLPVFPGPGSTQPSEPEQADTERTESLPAPAEPRRLTPESAEPARTAGSASATALPQTTEPAQASGPAGATARTAGPASVTASPQTTAPAQATGPASATAPTTGPASPTALPQTTTPAQATAATRASDPASATAPAAGPADATAPPPTTNPKTPAGQPQPATPPRPFPAPRPEPAAASRTVRWIPLAAIGLLVAIVVAAVAVATSGDDSAAAPTGPPTPATQPPPTSSSAPVQSLQFALRAAGGDQRCASHAFGDVQASLQQTSCSGVRRASYAATIDGRPGAVTVGIVQFPDAAQAAAFKAVADTPGGGGILDLATETGKWGATQQPQFENAAYASAVEGTAVRLVQAVWAPGPSTPDDPGLARAAKAALDLPAQ
ncbi:hypothetical protein M8542_16830 [Amycolatopsis sp. OK19-0408]|uniref:Uncharacterized protein n=1 Tax=Amycolatopsis iheyensis TaxID=2945988 RepID=A0A9X2NCS9_9PSEU|nr:hypothetical protein [Amycolatopsis iheyensis]MCR6484490.1 hypothetical protein [Amycolatopsis iheyensis]